MYALCIDWRRQLRLRGTGARATRRLPTVKFIWSLQSRTNSDSGLYVVAFVGVYCTNFIIFLCVIVKLFSLKFRAPPCTKSWRRHCLH